MSSNQHALYCLHLCCLYSVHPECFGDVVSLRVFTVRSAVVTSLQVLLLLPEVSRLLTLIKYCVSGESPLNVCVVPVALTQLLFTSASVVLIHASEYAKSVSAVSSQFVVGNDHLTVMVVSVTGPAFDTGG